MEVNKVNSWDDVVSDNYNQPTPEVKEETQQTESVQEGAESVEENQVAQEEVAQQETETQEQVQEEQVQERQAEVKAEESQEEVVKETIQERVAFEDLDEDELYELLTLKKTNYNEISDIDIVAGLISSEHENWSDEDIQFELEQKYGAALFEEKINLDEIDKDIDPEGYREAVKYNKEIDRAQKLLRRDALEVRAELEQYKANIQLPTSKVKTVDDNVKEVEAEGETEFEGPSPEEVAEHNRRWSELVESEVPSVKEFTFKLEDEDVSYKVTEEEQAQMVQKMKDFNAELYFANRGWVKADGSLDVKKITEDVYILENSEKMFKSGWTQAKEKAKMDIISKDIKNINLSSPEKTFDAKGGDKYDFGNFVLGL